MRMEFKFDKGAVDRYGFTMQSVFDCIAEQAREVNLKCKIEGNMLVVFGTGKKDDYSGMLTLLSTFKNEEWFIKTATHWTLETENTYGDILKQVKDKYKRGIYPLK
ncbi:MAG: hypothetical protein FWB72_01280 [Firmicutes bacterium]|nr:hypothetical protein [Bacillota bacterium]